MKTKLVRSSLLCVLLLGSPAWLLAQSSADDSDQTEQPADETVAEEKSETASETVTEASSESSTEKTPGPPADQRSIMLIEVKPDERTPHGKSAFIHGETDAIGDKFLVEGLDVMQPVYVGVYTKNASDKIHVRLAKDDLDKVEQEGNTEGTGKAEFKFRTHESFKIGIDAKEDTEYQIMVWVGDEMALEQPPVAVPASQYVEPENKISADGKSADVSFSYLELGLIGFVVVLLGVVAAFMFRKKK